MGAALFALATLAAGLTFAPAQAKTVKIFINNFRFCQVTPCGADDQGYVRSSEGESMLDNPAYEIPMVRVGHRITWVYMDQQPPGCDTFAGCSGHEVRFENGTPNGGKRIGFAPARMGAKTFTWVVPKSARGKILYYFCDVGDHWQVGMTGIISVAK